MAGTVLLNVGMECWRSVVTSEDNTRYSRYSNVKRDGNNNHDLRVLAQS